MSVLSFGSDTNRIRMNEFWQYAAQNPSESSELDSMAPVHLSVSSSVLQLAKIRVLEQTMENYTKGQTLSLHVVEICCHAGM